MEGLCPWRGRSAIRADSGLFGPLRASTAHPLPSLGRVWNRAELARPFGRRSRIRAPTPGLLHASATQDPPCRSFGARGPRRTVRSSAASAFDPRAHLSRRDLRDSGLESRLRRGRRPISYAVGIPRLPGPARGSPRRDRRGRGSRHEDPRPRSSDGGHARPRIRTGPGCAPAIRPVRRGFWAGASGLCPPLRAKLGLSSRPLVSPGAKTTLRPGGICPRSARASACSNATTPRSRRSSRSSGLRRGAAASRRPPRTSSAAPKRLLVHLHQAPRGRGRPRSR